MRVAVWPHLSKGGKKGKKGNRRCWLRGKGKKFLVIKEM